MYQPGFIRQMTVGGAAERAGRLRVGDRLLAVNGRPVDGASHEQAVLALLEPCLSMTLRVRHDPLPAGWQVSPGNTRHRSRASQETQPPVGLRHSYGN